MALHWIIDTKHRLIVATAEGAFTAQEVRAYLAMIAGANVLDYRQLLDFSRGTATFSAIETIELGALIRLQQTRSRPGPLAVVLPDQPAEPTARLLGMMAMAPRPMRLFNKREPAAKWLDELDGRADGKPGPSA